MTGLEWVENVRKPAVTVLSFMQWLRDKLRLRIGKDETVTIKTVYLDRIMVQCPDCGAGGMWAVPEGFTIAIGSHLRVICPNGHHWAISGIWAEEKSEEGEKP